MCIWDCMESEIKAKKGYWYIKEIRNAWSIDNENE